MMEVVQGIVRIGKNLNSRKNILLIHPWFFGDENSKYHISDIGEPLLGTKESDDYLLNLERLFSFKQNIFIFEDENKKLETIERILRTGKTTGRYIIPTEEKDSLPATLHKQKINREYYDEYEIMCEKGKWYEPEWDNVAEFLKRFSGDFYFAGGYSDECGCLTLTFEALKTKGIRGKFVKGCCFQRYAN